MIMYRARNNNYTFPRGDAQRAWEEIMKLCYKSNNLLKFPFTQRNGTSTPLKRID